MKKRMKLYVIFLIIALGIVSLLVSCGENDADKQFSEESAQSTVFKVKFDLGNDYFNNKYKDEIKELSVLKNSKIKAMPSLIWLESDLAKFKIENWELNGVKFSESEYIKENITLKAKYSIREIKFGEYPFSGVNPADLVLGEPYEESYSGLMVNNVAQQAVTVTYVNDDQGNKYEIRNGQYYKFEKIVWEVAPIDEQITVKPVANDTTRGTYFTPKEILDICDYYEEIEGKNTTSDKYYKYSRIRSWLNKIFLAKAFNEEEQSFIKERILYHNTSTGNDTVNDNETTKDIVFLPAVYDISQNTTFNMSRGKNSKYLLDKANPSYLWTRSPKSKNPGISDLYVNVFNMLDKNLVGKPSYRTQADAFGIMPIIFVNEQYYYSNLG